MLIPTNIGLSRFDSDFAFLYSYKIATIEELKVSNPGTGSIPVFI